MDFNTTFSYKYLSVTTLRPTLSISVPLSPSLTTCAHPQAKDRPTRERQKMWLLHTWHMDLHWVDNPGEERYAILSHVWNRDKEEADRWDRIMADHLERYPIDPNQKHRRIRRQREWPSGYPVQDREEEQTFQDVRQTNKERATNTNTTAETDFPIAQTSPSPHWTGVQFSQKLRGFCSLAHANGYQYAWMDACCIDRTNPDELSDALNAMYEWYAQAAVCYVYMRDVIISEDPHIALSAFRKSVWFTRSWTLQELLAPREVVFLTNKWTVIGTKTALSGLIEEITGIPLTIILHEAPLDTISVAQRMSWATSRRGAFVEDEAYSLMGIFGVYMPIAYGEGRHAFIRLQQEILTRSHVPDYSLFAWGGVLDWEHITYAYWQSVPNPGSEERTESEFFADRPSAFSHWSSSYEVGRNASPINWQALADRLGFRDGDAAANTPRLDVTSHGVRTRMPLLAFRMHDRKRRLSRVLYLGLLPCEDEEGRLMALAMSRVGYPAAAGDAHEFSVDLLWQFMTYRQNTRCRVLSLPATAVASQHGNVPVYDVHILQTSKRLPLGLNAPV